MSDETPAETTPAETTPAETTPAPPPKTPVLALVGRPNVGKSTLFNRLVGRRTALVDDRPGVTRDRIFGEAQMSGRLLRVVDTGGIDVDPQDVLLAGMRAQTQLAVEEADLVLLVVDGVEGVVPADREIAALLRKAGATVIVVVNKVDAPGHEDRVHAGHELGLAAVVGMSAEHGRGVDDLHDAVLGLVEAPAWDDIRGPQDPPLPVQDDSGDEPYGSRIEWGGGPIRVAVIGRPNAGKSSLVNRLIGDERLLATEVAGTTRDPIDTEVEIDGQRFIFIDTAGVRRKRSIADRLERFAVVKAFQSIDRADVVLMLVDATQRPTEQDARIAGMADEKGKGLVLVTNKWDLVENPQWRERYPDAVIRRLPFATYATILRVSAKTGRSVGKIFDAVIDAQRERHRRVATSELNRFFREKVADNPPPSRSGRRAKLFYVSQPMVRPPTFIFSSSHADRIHFSYKRYLENALRDRYGFGGTPIWLKFRDRGGQKKSAPRA